MPAESISIDQAMRNKLFYFVTNVVVYRESDGRCLILKRDRREKVHPERYAVPGGKLEWGDLDLDNPTRMNGDVIDFENAVGKLAQREVREEAGIEIYPELTYINNVVFVRPDGIPVVLLKFAARYKSGEVKVEEGAFTDHAWVNADEVKDYPCILGIPEEISAAIVAFSRRG